MTAKDEEAKQYVLAKFPDAVCQRYPPHGNFRIVAITPDPIVLNGHGGWYPALAWHNAARALGWQA